MEIESGPIGAMPFGWYSAEGWERVRAISEDPAHFLASYEQWCEVAQRQFDTFAAQGMPVEKIMIDPDELDAWCKQVGAGVNSKARATYAVIAWQKHHGKSN